MDVLTLWSRLLPIQTLTFEARSRALSNLGWNGTGAGSVRVEPIEPSVILFHESGSWTSYQGPPTNFRNIFRWTLGAEQIRLEHLRYFSIVRTPRLWLRPLHRESRGVPNLTSPDLDHHWYR
jgi:hypothetical protein